MVLRQLVKLVLGALLARVRVRVPLVAVVVGLAAVAICGVVGLYVLAAALVVTPDAVRASRAGVAGM